MRSNCGAPGTGDGNGDEVAVAADGSREVVAVATTGVALGDAEGVGELFGPVQEMNRAKASRTAATLKGGTLFRACPWEKRVSTMLALEARAYCLDP